MKTVLSILLASVLIVVPMQASCARHGSSQDQGRFRNGAPEMYDLVFDRFASDAATGSVPASWPYDTISLERTACFGRCPVYKVTLHRDGSGELHVTDYFSVPNGDWVGKIGTRMFGRLCHALESIGFQALDASYSAKWTDDSTCIVTASSEKGSKSISDYGTVAPIGLWMFQETVDSVVRRVKWLPK